MVDSLEYKYLEWMIKQIRPDNDRSYHDLFARIHDKEFVWLIPNDDNRIADGFDIRHEYFRRFKRPHMLSQGCSVLEVILGLSRRLSFAVDGKAKDWAWVLVKNLELHKMAGHIGGRRAERIDEVLEALIWRTYAPDGVGGFFPLAWPEQDQRKVEIWYQMCAYIDELPEM